MIVQNRNISDKQIAIILLTYNRYEGFQLALKSALSQKQVDFHIFVFDNCSTTPLDNLIDNDKSVTYIRHKKNIGFANNFRFAADFVKKSGYQLSFLLADDDLIAYSYVLRDLLKLMEKEKDIHVTRGGFVEFVKKPSNFTRIFTYNNSYLARFSSLSEIEKAMSLHLPYYSGILFKTQLFQADLSPYDDLVTPFLAPLLKILLSKKFAFLPNKVTILNKTDHNQLATQVYNQNYFTFIDIVKAFKLVGRNYPTKTTIFELINYKIYGQNKNLISQYYKKCLEGNKGFDLALYHLIYFTPSLVLKRIKALAKWLLGVRTKIVVYISHRYLLREG